MLWECPFGRRDGSMCRRFDGPCEPRSQGCLLANAPYLESEPGDERDAPVMTIQPVPWPQMLRPRRHPTRRRARARRRASASERSSS